MLIAGSRMLVTGGGRRLGRAIVDDLTARGAVVAFTFHTDLKLSDKRGIRADLSDPARAGTAVDEAAARLGGLDALIHAASGGFEPVDPTDVTPELFDRATSVTLRGGFFAMQAAQRAMGEPGGSIVAITDVAAFEQWPRFAPHCAAKAGLAQLVRTLALAWAPRVRVNAVAPGPVLLPDGASAEANDRYAAETALGRLGEPTDVTAAVAFLLENEFTTGSQLVVDGGHSLR